MYHEVTIGAAFLQQTVKIEEGEFVMLQLVLEGDADVFLRKANKGKTRDIFVGDTAAADVATEG